MMINMHGDRGRSRKGSGSGRGRGEERRKNWGAAHKIEKPIKHSIYLNCMWLTIENRRPLLSYCHSPSLPHSLSPSLFLSFFISPTITIFAGSLEICLFLSFSLNCRWGKGTRDRDRGRGRVWGTGLLISKAGHVTRGKAKGDKGDNNKKLNMNENANVNQSQASRATKKKHKEQKEQRSKERRRSECSMQRKDVSDHSLSLSLFILPWSNMYSVYLLLSIFPDVYIF